MAGFVFVPYSADGHVHPMLPVAAELVAAGEPVRMIAGARFAARIAGVGASAVPADRESEVWSPPRWGPGELARLARVRSGRAVALRALARRCAAEFRARRPAAVVVDPAVPAAAKAARRLGIPVVWFSPTHARSPRLAGTVLVNSLPELQPRRHRFGHRFHFVGPLLAPAQRCAPSLPGPLLLVSPGTVFARTATFFRSIVEEFADSEWTVRMATGHLAPAELGPLPDNVLARRWLPQRALLAETTVFLTHGGMNSVQEALAEAVPMLLAPRNREQRATARRLVGLELGARLRGSARQAAEQLAADPRTRSALEEVQVRIRRGDTARLAARTLVQAARGS
ncbi:nucleotide disphospho-sugar-binding domain-containing protein [Saccharopolyspora sp. 5N708]|uniref:nucleotide disphospho-sugar-binding domain-containing protein n=1 Tax=Saccharopolyspora sp. 5N708 TaxID=3457424 RepID=UPI003FD67C5C